MIEFDSTARLQSLSIGSGSTIIDELCATILRNVKYEVIFATCFWAESSSLLSVASLLRNLSRKATSEGAPRKIDVRICISSVSFWQKILHTTSTQGHLYPPSMWQQRLRLPRQEDLPGVDLQVKSIFIRPFSVIHSKYIIIDRQIALFPSCNVSFEEWFEGTITAQGPIVGQLFNFWQSFWTPDRSTFSLPESIVMESDDPTNSRSNQLTQNKIKTFQLKAGHVTIPISADTTLATLLPSQHHWNPQFHPWPWQKVSKPPATRLNQFTCQCIRNSKAKLFFQTPNFTCRPVIDSILQALVRGVEVHIVTNNRLMTLEQLITAGTTTPQSMRRLIRSYNKIESLSHTSHAVEEGRVQLGKLTITYFDRLQFRDKAGIQSDKSHLKLTVIDEQITILGSGNMDRASWYTSQELGIAFYSSDLSKAILRHTQQIFAKSITPHDI